MNTSLYECIQIKKGIEARALYIESDVYLPDDPLISNYGVQVQYAAELGRAVEMWRLQLDKVAIVMIHTERHWESRLRNLLVIKTQGDFVAKKKKQLQALLSGGSSLFLILGRAVLLLTTAIETCQRLFLGMIYLAVSNCRDCAKGGKVAACGSRKTTFLSSILDEIPRI